MARSTRASGLAGLVCVALAAVSLAAASPARAGTWVQVSCVNPNGSAAPSDGWSGVSGTDGVGSLTNALCGPGRPMEALLSVQNPLPPGSAEKLVYTPPAGSTLVGGTLDGTFSEAGSGTDAEGVILMNLSSGGSTSFYDCLHGGSGDPCPPGSDDYTGQVTLPADTGGALTITAACGGAAGGSCDASSDGRSYADAQVASADMTLANSSAPQATRFSGSALARTVSGFAHLVFTATDPGGPGVYAVSVAIDGRVVWSGTPDADGGSCVAVGTIGGALMFDHAQPCPPTAVADVPVPTSTLSDGRHALAVTVSDAAGNASTVFDQTITTSNPQKTPVPRAGRRVRARFLLGWHWAGARTTLRSVAVHGLPRGGALAVSCRGRGCPRLPKRATDARHMTRFARALRNRRFRAGDRLRLTATAPHRRAERVELRIRDGHRPSARLLDR